MVIFEFEMEFINQDISMKIHEKIDDLKAEDLSDNTKAPKLHSDLFP